MIWALFSDDGIIEVSGKVEKELQYLLVQWRKREEELKYTAKKLVAAETAESLWKTRAKYMSGEVLFGFYIYLQ